MTYEFTKADLSLLKNLIISEIKHYDDMDVLNVLANLLTKINIKLKRFNDESKNGYEIENN